MRARAYPHRAALSVLATAILLSLHVDSTAQQAAPRAADFDRVARAAMEAENLKRAQPFPSQPVREKFANAANLTRAYRDKWFTSADSADYLAVTYRLARLEQEAEQIRSALKSYGQCLVNDHLDKAPFRDELLTSLRKLLSEITGGDSGIVLAPTPQKPLVGSSRDTIVIPRPGQRSTGSSSAEAPEYYRITPLWRVAPGGK